MPDSVSKNFAGRPIPAKATTGMPERYKALIERAKTEKVPLRDLEFQTFGATHAEVGAFLLGAWGLPYSVVEAVAHHHEPTRAGSERFDVVGAVHVASALAEKHVPLFPRGSERAEGDFDLGYLVSIKAAARITSFEELGEKEAKEAIGGRP